MLDVWPEQNPLMSVGGDCEWDAPVERILARLLDNVRKGLATVLDQPFAAVFAFSRFDWDFERYSGALRFDDDLLGIIGPENVVDEPSTT